MIQKLFILLLTTLSISCVTTQPVNRELTQDDQRIRAVIFSVDSKIWGDYGRANNGIYTAFSETEYNSRLSKLNAPRAQEMREILPSFAIREISAHPGTFVFCGYSPDLRIAFCDDAACQGVEYFEKSTQPTMLEQWKSKLPKETCAKDLQ